MILLLACVGSPLGAPEPPAGEVCPGADPVESVDATVELVLLAGPGVGWDELAEQTGRLRGYFEPWGLDFTLAEHQRVSETALLGDVDAERALAPFLEEHAVGREDGQVVVALLPSLVQPGSGADHYFDELFGLGLSTELLAEQGFPELAALAPAPTVLLSRDQLGHRHPGHLDLTLAHELGHAAGLPHVSERHNLLHDGAFRCVPGLDGEQLAALGDL